MSILEIYTILHEHMVCNDCSSTVAKEFVKQYYFILENCPEKLHKFYKEPSLLSWPGVDGILGLVTSLDEINEEIMSSEYRHCLVEVKTTNSQITVDGGIIVVVTGCLSGTDNVKKNFSQTFFLAKQEKGFYILNDILRFLDVCETTTNISSASNVENDQPSSPQNSVNITSKNAKVSSVVELAITANVSLVVEPTLNANVSLVVEPTTVVNVPSSVKLATDVNASSAVQPAKTAKAPSVVALATSVKAPLIVAPTTNVKALSIVTPEKNSNDRSVIASTANAKIPSTLASTVNPIVTSNITPTSNSALKFSYASMLVKEAPKTSPKAAIVTLNVDKQMLAPPTTKASIPLDIGSQKISNHSGSVSKSFMSSRNIAPKAPTSAHGAPNTSPYVEAKGIYIGGLPFDITKQGVVDVVKKFGPVRNSPNTIQIVRHEDGFCCGFVEFESADAAHRAVKAHLVMFGKTEAYIMYKRSSYNRVNNGGARS
ncbi:hypothetical protein ACS0TY_005301 [Phlomoides rotata]